MLSHSSLKKQFDSRRTGRKQKALLGHSSFYVYDAYSDGSLCIQHGRYYRLAVAGDPNFTGLREVVRIWPDGRFIFTPVRSGKHKYRSYPEAKLLEDLSARRFTFLRNTSVKTLGWRYVQLKPTRGYYTWDRDAPQFISPGATEFIPRPDGSWDTKALEPVLVREWIPEGRRVYLESHRALSENLQVRAQIGAFDPLIARKDLLWKDKISSPETSIASADIDDHESLKRVAVNTLRYSGASPKDGQDLAKELSRFMDRPSHREALRRKHRAVRYVPAPLSHSTNQTT